MCDNKGQTAGLGSSLTASGHGGTGRLDAAHWAKECYAAVAQRDEAQTELTQHQKCVQDICHLLNINDGYSLKEITGTVQRRLQQLTNACRLAGEQKELIDEQQRRIAWLEQHIVQEQHVAQTAPDHAVVEQKSPQQLASEAVTQLITTGEWMSYSEIRQHVCNLSHDYASFNRKS